MRSENPNVPTLGQIWTKPKGWVENVIKTQFNPMAGFVHI